MKFKPVAALLDATKLHKPKLSLFFGPLYPWFWAIDKCPQLLVVMVAGGEWGGGWWGGGLVWGAA